MDYKDSSNGGIGFQVFSRWFSWRYIFRIVWSIRLVGGIFRKLIQSIFIVMAHTLDAKILRIQKSVTSKPKDSWLNCLAASTQFTFLLNFQGVNISK